MIQSFFNLQILLNHYGQLNFRRLFDSLWISYTINNNNKTGRQLLINKHKNGFNPADLRHLDSFIEKDYFDWFINENENYEMIKQIKGVLEKTYHSTKDSHIDKKNEEIRKRITNALNKIGEKDAIIKLRVNLILK